MRTGMLFSAACALAIPAATIAAQPVTYALPADTVPAVLADAQIVVTNCSGCHSLDYIVTQPRHKGPQFWRDAVTKMVNVYKAPIEPSDADAVAEELARKFD